MDKAVIILILAFLLPFNGQSQNWTTIDKDDLGVLGSWWGPNQGRKAFRVNKLDGDIWWARNFTIYNIKPNGFFSMHSNSTDPVLPTSMVASFQAVEILNNDVYIVEDNAGFVYKFNDNTQWSQVSGPTEAAFMSVDEDSLWVCQIGDGMIKMVNGIPQYYPDWQRRIQSRNGHAWSCSGHPGNWTNIMRYYEPLTYQYHSADTAAFVLDNYLNDFKFMNNSDTLYLSGNQGFSIATGSQFVDTLTSNNTVNQPSGRIIEFEFDFNDNVWALFGTDITTITNLAFLDRATNEWTQVYDESNSPIDFSNNMSLELDAQGNVYVITLFKLHILEGNTPPEWLSVFESDQIEFEVYPNPSTGEIRIDVSPEINVETIEFVDLNGNVLQEEPFSSVMNVNLPSGVYLLLLKEGNEIIGRKKQLIH